MNTNDTESNPVYSARINKEIQDEFKKTCKRFHIDHKYVIQEYMKKFVVLNINKESYESPIFLPENKTNLETDD